MRATRRNFVVEYKTRSRQSKSDKPVSIWGDTDLKAVARQVEEQSTRLFTKAVEEPVVEQPVSNGPELESDRPPVTVAPDSESRMNDQETTPPAAEAMPSVAVADGLGEEVSSPSPAVASPVVKRSEEKPVRRRYVRRIMPAAVENDGIVQISRADLDALQEENIRLKSALRKRLSADNDLLRAMLSRFS